MGTLTKQIYRYTHKRNMRHNENLWPFVKIKRKTTGEISELKYKNTQVVLTELSSLQDHFSGSVLLTATGPSVKKIDFAKRPDGIMTAGVNGAWHLNDKLHFSLYFIVDMTFIDHHKTIVKNICTTENIVLFTTVMGVVKMLEMMGDESIQCQFAIIEDICYQTYKPAVRRENIPDCFSTAPAIIFSKTHPEIAFSNDIRHGVFDAGTVVYWALQVLGFIGFETIFIAGLDLNNLSTPRFYEDEKSMRPSFLHEKLSTVVLPALALASETLANKGIRIINLSLQSAVPESIFPKQAFQD